MKATETLVVLILAVAVWFWLKKRANNEWDPIPRILGKFEVSEEGEKRDK